MNGKGPRPRPVKGKLYRSNYTRIFKKKMKPIRSRKWADPDNFSEPDRTTDNY